MERFEKKPTNKFLTTETEIEALLRIQISVLISDLLICLFSGKLRNFTGETFSAKFGRSVHFLVTQKALPSF